MYGDKLIAITETSEFLPVYRFKYNADGTSLMGKLKSLAFGLQHFMSAQASLIDKQVEMQPVFQGKMQEALGDSGQSLGIQTGERGNVTIPTVPLDLQNFRNIVITYKDLMHFASGISEEAMAGFSGALDVSTSSIDARMASTVRVSAKIQAFLKDFLEQMNRDWIRLMQEKYPKRKMNKLPNTGVIPDLQDYTITDLGAGIYENSIGFASIIPRSDTAMQQTIISLRKNNVISSETALNTIGESLGIDDPQKEINMVQQEFTKKARLNKALEQDMKVSSEALSPFEEVKVILEDKTLPIYNLDLIKSVDQKPYIEEIDKALVANPGNIFLLSMKNKHIEIMENQSGPKAQVPGNPNELVSQVDNKLLGGGNPNPQPQGLPGMQGDWAEKNAAAQAARKAAQL